MKSHSGCFVVKIDGVLISTTLLFASNTVVAATAAAVFTSSCTDADPSHLLSLSLHLTKLNCALGSGETLANMELLMLFIAFTFFHH